MIERDTLIKDLREWADALEAGGELLDQPLIASLRSAAEMLGNAFTSPWMLPDDAARYARCSARSLEDYRRLGGGPFYHRQGARVVLYHKDDLDTWRGQGRAANTADERLRGVKLAG